MSIRTSRPTDWGAYGAIGAIAMIMVCAAVDPAHARTRGPDPTFAPSYAAPSVPVIANGAIFQAVNGYSALTNGSRASMVGDIVTIVLVEKTQAVKANSASTDRSGNIAVTPAVTGPIGHLFKGTDVSGGAGATFAGKGAAAQSNQLDGEISVTIARIYPNGTLMVRGEKLLTLNRGDENINITGIIRAADIGPDNRVLSTRVADARIAYSGKGEIARASRQGWLNRFFSMLSPF
ncbi:MAG: Flagellar L-ring protein [Rhizorhabdus sp.]|nr:Flagellar L-ring protein [Rhizorhabdus sp.]